MEHIQGGGGCFIQTQGPVSHTPLSLLHTDLEAAGVTVALQVAGVSCLGECMDVLISVINQKDWILLVIPA